MGTVQARIENLDRAIALSKAHVSIRLAIVESLLSVVDSDAFGEVKQVMDRISDSCDLLSLIIDSLKEG